MTAIRVVTDHQELENIGGLTHAQLDNYVNNSSFVVVSGTSGPVPPSARRITAGSNIVITDNGPGADLVISSTASGGSGGTSQVISWGEIPTGTSDGVNLDFVLAHAPSDPTAVMFFVNGVLQTRGSTADFTVSGQTVHLNSTYRSGSSLQATYPYNVTSSVSQMVWMEVPSGLVNGSNTTFTLAHTPSPSSALMFFVNGVLQLQGSTNDYLVSTNVISMNYAPRSGSNLNVTYPY